MSGRDTSEKYLNAPFEQKHAPLIAALLPSTVNVVVEADMGELIEYGLYVGVKAPQHLQIAVIPRNRVERRRGPRCGRARDRRGGGMRDIVIRLRSSYHAGDGRFVASLLAIEPYALGTPCPSDSRRVI